MDHVKVDFNQEDFERVKKRFEKLNRNIQDEIIKKNKQLKRETKNKVISALRPGHGVKKGIYRRSIVIRDLSEYDSDLSFQVGANKGHHRLTHLIENGHRIKLHGVFINKRTRAFPHIKPGQDYVDQKAVTLFEEAIKKAIKED